MYSCICIYFVVVLVPSVIFVFLCIFVLFEYS